jgi:hypothetical protein
MSSEKVKIIGYVTPSEKETIQVRAKQLGMSIGAYYFELAMWDNRFNLIPQLRKGGSITCNGKEKA